MKMQKNTENLIKNRMAALILVLACTLAVAAGCGKKTDEGTEPTTPSATVTKEETTPEVVEPTESAPVETVEPTETVSEENTTIDLTKYDNAPDCISDLKQMDELMVIVWNDENGGRTILKDGDHYTNSMLSSFFFNRTNENGNIKDTTLECNDNNAEIREIKEFYGLITTVGEDVEYKTTFTYNDGTEETITVYITKELAE